MNTGIVRKFVILANFYRTFVVDKYRGIVPKVCEIRYTDRDGISLCVSIRGTSRIVASCFSVNGVLPSRAFPRRR